MAAGDLCGCGKPSSHKGMCSARWAKRKANNGPSGIAEKPVVDGAMSEEAIARRLFGDLADDILLLRSKGHRVARFHDGFRVDRDVLSEDQLRARAKALRKKIEESKAGPEQEQGAEASTSDDALQADRQEPPARSARRVGRRADATHGIALTRRVIPEVMYGDQGGRDAPSVENAREGRNGVKQRRGSPSNQDPPAVADASSDLESRVAQLEQRLDRLTAALHSA